MDLELILRHLKEIKLDVHLHYHGDSETLHLLRELKSQGEKIMATQKDMAEEMKATTEQLKKVAGESRTLIEKIAALQTVIESGPVSPELQAAWDEVKAQAKVTDDVVPDEVPPSA